VLTALTSNRIAVTGATGFIGRALCSQLQASGAAPRAIIREGAPERPKDWSDVVAVGDIGPDTSWTAALAGVDCVVHCAARVHVMRETGADPLAAFRQVNVAGTRRLAEAAAAMGVRRLVYLSSIKVNGDSTLAGAMFSHDDIPAPEDPYGVSKWEAEVALQEVAADSSLEMVIVRPPLVYGPGVKANFLRLVRLVRNGVPLPLGSVKNKRSLVSLDNLVDLLIRCTEHPAAAGQTLLASDGQDLSTPELIRGLAAAMGRSARLLPVPPALLRLGGRLSGRLDEVERLIGSLQVDIEHTCQTLDWKPPVAVAEGLRRAMAGSL
jgi:nucleoside-diphosphate-sugar epimerase